MAFRLSDDVHDALDRLQAEIKAIHDTGKDDIYTEHYMASINLLAAFGRINYDHFTDPGL